ncbi:RuBisCO large subunit-binding protein subunit beta, chloroplastic [Capsicum annuum]|nr:RuBisCO large subunit-binding protein subunit beta, chloroplastic [Capsicum annuum]
MHSGTIIREEVGLYLEKAGSEVLGNAAKVVLAKESTTIVGGGSTQDAVSKRIAQIKRLLEVRAQTETELKRKETESRGCTQCNKAVDEGIVVGGGCTLLRLAAKVEDIKGALDNNEQKIGANIVKRSLRYPMKLIAKNAGVNGSVVNYN